MSSTSHYLEVELTQLLRAGDTVWDFLRAGSLDGVWYWDLEKPEHEYMSPEFWRLFGIDPGTKQHLAAEWQDMIFAEDLELAGKNLQKHLDDPSRPYDQVVRYRHMDGHTVWVRCRGLAIRDENGKPTRLLGAHNDITAQKREEQQALEARRAVQTDLSFRELVLKSIPDLVFVKDADFKIVLGNENFLGVYPEEMRDQIIGTTTIEHYDAFEREAFLKQDKIAFEEGQSETEESIDFPDGQRRVLHTKKVRFDGPDGNPLILGIGRDITDLVAIRQENEFAIRLLESVFNAVGSAIIALDHQGRIMQLNDRARHMLGGISEPLPLSWPSNIHFLDIETMKSLDNSADPIQRALSGHRVRNETHLMQRVESGEDQRYVRVDCEPVQTSSSDIKLVVVLDDVSEQERNRQVVERQSRLDALGQLTGGIAHDFNNLLGAMMYAVDLAQEETDETQRAEYLQIALDTVQRGRDLTSRLLAFAKRQPGLATARNTQEVFDEFRKLIRPMLEASIEIHFSVEDTGIMHFCDQPQFETALMNLVLNARDAILRSGQGNKIEVTARSIRATTNTLGAPVDEDADSEPITSYNETPYRYVEVNVSDNGPGMDEETVKRCTDPFFTTKSTNSGTGLGLAMVYGFARQSSGDLKVYSDLDVGTNVQLVLPRASVDGKREQAMSEEPHKPGSGETILVVEDEPMLLSMINNVIKRIGYKTITAYSGKDALAILEQGQKVDLLLTDVVMPNGIGGFELARLVREKFPDMPVIYTSGYTGYTMAEMGTVHAPLLRKPTPRNVLANALADALAGVVPGGQDDALSKPSGTPEAKED